MAGADNDAYKQELKARAARQAHWEQIVKAATTAVVASSEYRGPAILTHFHYGAMGIDPKHLAIWFIYKTDQELATARNDGHEASLAALTRGELTKFGFPETALPHIHVGCESDETITREAGGDYFHFFK